MIAWSLEVIVAAYAAIVGTGALALEIRRWVESGARLSMDVSAPMRTFNLPATEGQEYLIATVTNRGDTPTTISTMALLTYPNIWMRWRGRSSRSAIVANPILPGQERALPKTVSPGDVWQGVAVYNDELRDWAKSGNLYVAIYASHSDRPTIQRVRIHPENAKEHNDGQ